MSPFGTFRTSRYVRVESVMRSKAEPFETRSLSVQLNITAEPTPNRAQLVGGSRGQRASRGGGGPGVPIYAARPPCVSRITTLRRFRRYLLMTIGPADLICGRRS